MPNLVIREAKADDEAAWRELWLEFLDYYQVVLPKEITGFTWARLLDPASPLCARLAFVDDQAAGFALHQHHPSSWVMGDDCYLEDLFVTPACRGAGVGRALIEDLIAHARLKGWKRLYWNTDADNRAARKLYDQFTPDDGHVRYRLVL